MESDEDDIFNTSVFSEDGGISKGDLVWAPLDYNGKEVMWPALVTSIRAMMGVKMLGRSKRVTKVTGCVPYRQNSQYETEASDIPEWVTAKSEAKEILDKPIRLLCSTPEPGASSSTTSEETTHPNKRRKLGKPNSARNAGFVEGDIVWAKYRSHPIWPAKIEVIEENGFLMIRYLKFDECAIRTAIKNVSHFDGPDYISNVEAGINSTISVAFKRAYLQAYEGWVKLHPDEEINLVSLSTNGLMSPKEPISPKKGKNQLVHFINKNEAMFSKMLQGRLCAHYHKQYKQSNGKVAQSAEGALFGSFAKTELEEERVIAAIGAMQAKFTKRHKLTQAYGLSVMLPEAIIRLIMFKKRLSYPKAKELYIADVSKVSKKDKEKVREAMLNTPICRETKEEYEELSNLKLEKMLREPAAAASSKGKRKRGQGGNNHGTSCVKSRDL